MSDQVFKPGDLVQLKSGGPTMTVKEVENLRIHCEWFVYGEPIPYSHIFHSAQLQPKDKGLSWGTYPRA